MFDEKCSMGCKKTQEMPDEPERRQTSFRMIQKIKCLQNLLISSLQNYICREFFKIFIQKFNKSNSMKIIYIPNSLYRKTTTKYSLSSLPYTHSIITQLLWCDVFNFMRIRYFIIPMQFSRIMVYINYCEIVHCIEPHGKVELLSWKIDSNLKSCIHGYSPSHMWYAACFQILYFKSCMSIVARQMILVQCCRTNISCRIIYVR